MYYLKSLKITLTSLKTKACLLKEKEHVLAWEDQEAALRLNMDSGSTDFPGSMCQHRFFHLHATGN